MYCPIFPGNGNWDNNENKSDVVLDTSWAIQLALTPTGFRGAFAKKRPSTLLLASNSTANDVVLCGEAATLENEALNLMCQ